MQKMPAPLRFIGPIVCLPVAKVPEGEQWQYELKLDGYRAIARKICGRKPLNCSETNKKVRRRWLHRRSHAFVLNVVSRIWIADVIPQDKLAMLAREIEGFPLRMLRCAKTSDVKDARF
jgi:hypothetical protein